MRTRVLRSCILAAALLSAGWGSCGAKTFSCTYDCAANQTQSGRIDVESKDATAAEEECRSTKAGDCPDFSCICSDNAS
jgi:hypothetical protein